MILTSIRITEYKYYYDNGNLKLHYYMKENKFHGEYKCYYENGNIEIDAYYKNGDLNKNYKTYDAHAVLTEHIFYRDLNKRHWYNKLCAEYKNNKMNSYYVIGIDVHIIVLYHNINDCEYVNHKIVDPLILLQKRFKQKINSKQLTILNQFLINDISLLILSYIKN
jgi:hypothetical protein